MGRRKTVDVVQLQSGGSYQGRSSDHLCTREFLEKKYDAAVSEIRPTTLYEDTTTYHINRIEGLFREYCSTLSLETLQTLSECATARIENFLHWLLNVYNIKKTSTVTTYWRQLSQVYILWTQQRVDPNILKQIFVFIEGPLTAEYSLDNVETEKPLLEADDFVQLIQYHWVSDINIFPNERQRVQLAAILLLAAFTGSRPHALLSLTYRDLDLYIDRNNKTGAHVLKLGVQLTKTKSRQKRKRPKTYTFNLDDNPLFCIISHIISLAFDDEAFGVPGLISPDQLFRLRAKRSNGCQPIPWKTEMLDTPIFRRAIATKQGVRTSPDKALTYTVYNSWVKRLGEALGYLQTLTTYCLRRALGNAINDDPNSNAAVRNLALDHTGSMMFERNYLSRMIRYNTQDAFWGRTPDHDSAKAASRIGRLRDPNRPKKLNEEQALQIREHPRILELVATRDRLRAEMLADFGVIKMAVGNPIHEDYQVLGRLLNSTIRAEERALLKRVQEEYDVTAPVIEIQRQLNEEFSDDDDISEPETVQMKFIERRRIAEAALSDSSSFTDQKGSRRHIDLCVDMIALCKRRERRRPRTNRFPGRPPVKIPDDQIIPKPEPEEKRNVPLKCQGFQCLFCLASNLSLEDKQQVFASKRSLQRHTDRCRLNHYQSDEDIPCPDDCACGGVILKGKMHFKNHGARVHDFFL